MDRLRRVFKNSFSSAAKQNVASTNAKTKKNLKHTKSMPIRRSLEYPPDYPTSLPPKIPQSGKSYTSRFTTRNKLAASQPLPRNVNADLQEDEDYGKVLDIHSGVTVITREDLDAFPMPPTTLPQKVQALHGRSNEAHRQHHTKYSLTMHGNASMPAVYHHGSIRHKHVSPSTANANMGSHRGRSRFSKPLPPSPGDWEKHLNSPSMASLHSSNQHSSSRRRQESTTPHRSRSRAAPNSHQRVQEHSQYMTEQGMASYPGIENVAAVRQGHAVYRGESDHRKSHRVEILFTPGDEPVPVGSVGLIRRDLDDYLVEHNLARNLGEPF